MPQYILIAEFVDKRVGFIIGAFNDETKAKSLVDHVSDEFTSYSLNSLLEIPLCCFVKYQSYEVRGDEYFTDCDRYRERFCRTNGDLTVSVIKCKGLFDAKAFIEYRNFFGVYGVMMN